MTGAELIAKFANTADTKQMSNYLAYQKQSVDLFSMPLDKKSDLDAITKSYRYKGMKIKVLNIDTDNIMTEYWWNGAEWALVTEKDKFSIETDKKNSSIVLKYGDKIIGEAADLSGILQDWQYDLHIVSGTTVEEDGKTYLELYTNDLDGDGPDETVRIDVSNLGGGTHITVEGSDIEE